MGDADLHGTVAEHLLGLHVLLHRRFFRVGRGIPGGQVAQFRTLMVLSREGSLPVSEVARRLDFSRPYMTALADRLIAEQFVERCPDRGDRRVIHLAITGQGRAYLGDASARLKDEIRGLLAELDDQDLGTLCTSLGETREILSKLG